MSTSFCDFVRVCRSLSLSLSPNSNIQPKQYAALTMSTNYHFHAIQSLLSSPCHVQTVSCLLGCPAERFQEYKDDLSAQWRRKTWSFILFLHPLGNLRSESTHVQVLTVKTSPTKTSRPYPILGFQIFRQLTPKNFGTSTDNSPHRLSWLTSPACWRASPKIHGSSPASAGVRSSHIAWRRRCRCYEVMGPWGKNIVLNVKQLLGNIIMEGESGSKMSSEKL